MIIKNKLSSVLFASSIALTACNSGANNSNPGVAGATSTLSATQQGKARPISQYNSVLSPNGPEVSIAELNKIKKSGAKLLKSAEDTYTYVRCYYAKNADQHLDTSTTRPETDYVWAKNSDGSYYELPGNWHTDGLMEWSNMFFTNQKLANIKIICDRTVKEKISNNKFSFYQVAADNRLSYNQTIWQNDDPKDMLSESINKVIAFGDSLSDINNMYNASQWTLPSEDSWFQGRFSNGITWIEYLAEELKVPLYNWAIGGSAADTQKIVMPGLKQQIASWIDYKTSAQHYDPSRSLVTIFIGGNDFVNYDRSVDSLISDVKDSVGMLALDGVKHIVLLNLPDLTTAPVFHMGKSKQDIADKITKYNTRLESTVKNLRSILPNLDLKLFDTKAALDDVLTNPSKYGFKNTYDPCLEINDDSALNYLGSHKARSTCSNADEFLFWDSLHITTKMHSILASKVLKFIND